MKTLRITTLCISLAITSAAQACPWVPGWYGPQGHWHPGHCAQGGWTYGPRWGWTWYHPGEHWFYRRDWGWRHW